MISENTLRNSEFEEKMQLFLYDLIFISTAKYNKVSYAIRVMVLEFIPNGNTENSISIVYSCI